MKKFLSLLRYSALDQNALLVQLLGLYPAVVLTTSGKGGFIMGFFVTLVLILTGCFMSLLRPLLSEHTRLCVAMLLIATESTALSLLAQAYFPGLFSKYSVFFEMLCVCSIILARSETFSRHAPLVKSFWDALGTGVGYTAVLFILGLTREFLGAGTLFSSTPFAIQFSFFSPIKVFLHPAGSLLLLGFLTAAFQSIRRKNEAAKEKKEGV